MVSIIKRTGPGEPVNDHNPWDMRQAHFGAYLLGNLAFWRATKCANGRRSTADSEEG